MSGAKKKTPAEELIESLLKDVGEDSEPSDSEEGFKLSSDEEGESGESGSESEELDQDTINEFLGQVQGGGGGFMMTSDKTEFGDKTQNEYEKTRHTVLNGKTTPGALQFDTELPEVPSSEGPIVAQKIKNKNSPPPAPVASGAAKSDSEATDIFAPTDSMVTKPLINDEPKVENVVKFDAPATRGLEASFGDNEKTVAVAGYQYRNNGDDFVGEKVSVGQNRSGYAVWNSGGSAESNLAQADNLRIAQEKIIELESENEKLRLQNEELMAASEIIKERSDLLSSQLSEFKNDREGLEDSFKNEIVLLKNHLAKKDNELQKATLKNDELESRLKFDMKKIRVRERELENRLELIRAEKNAIVKNKDEQILDLRRKMDVLQMEVESYRQKCVELNKLIETNQESFKRTTRALRLAMANLELQEENKVPMKKAE
jgi:hypothetical protein